jgi:polysaccharide export outer membrane protein
VPTHTTPDGKVPVIYQVNLRDPASFFAAQGFPMHNKDVMYVANAPGAELQKFLTMLTDVVIPIATVRGVLR